MEHKLTTEEIKELAAHLADTGYIPFCGFEFVDAYQGYAKWKVELRDELRNPSGIAHGGMLFSIMDTTAGAVARYADGTHRICVTQGADIHYLKPGTGGTIYAEGHCLHVGKSTALIQVEATDERGRVLATGTFSMFIVGSVTKVE